MFVTNHVLSGALIGQLLPEHPAIACLAGLASHLVLDSLPHWGCDTTSPEGRERFLRVARWDGLLGLGAIAASVAAADRRARIATISAVAGAVVLDLDKPFAHFLGIAPFPRIVQKFHGRIQNESPEGLSKEFVWGAGFLAADVAVSSRHWNGTPAT